MNCIILGDKYQKGMKSKGCAGLIDLNKKTNILQHQYDILKSFFKDIDITYIYGFDSKKFLEFCKDSDLSMKIVYNEHYTIYNQGFSLRLAKDILANTDTLIVDGYIKLNKNIFKKFDRDIGSQVFINNTANEGDRVGCVINSDNLIENFSFDLDNNIEQIYYLDKQSCAKLGSILDNPRYNNYFIFELLNLLIDAGYNIQPKKI
jgi:CTP:phosphocholine cytidylyltransferase-like protein